MNVFKEMDGLGTAVRWVVCLAALAVSCLALALTVGANRTSVHRDKILCIASGKTTTAVNDAHRSIRDLISKNRDNALSRIGTSKELPTDKETVRYFSQFLSTIHTTSPLNCETIHG